MINEAHADAPYCDPCARPYIRIEALETPPVAETSNPKPRGAIGRAVPHVVGFSVSALMLLGVIGPLLSLALHPEWRLLALALVGPKQLIPLLLAGAFLWHLGSSFGEIRDLVRDRKVRVIHGLEHATATVLEQQGGVVHGGLTHPTFFELLVALMSVAATVIGLLLHLSPTTLVAVAVANLILLACRRPLGLLAQRAFTVSTTFRSARVLRIVRTISQGGERACFDVYLHVR